MGIFDGVVDELKPHATALNDTISGQGAMIHNRLATIQDLLSDMGRPDYGDHWYRLILNAETAEELANVELGPYTGTGPSPLMIERNQTWLIQWAAITKNTATSAVLMNSQNDALLVLTGAGTNVSVGGNIAFLPGEHVRLVLGKGAIAGTLQVIVRTLPASVTKPHPTQLGPRAELVAGTPTHDPNRDYLVREPGPWVATPREPRDTMGAPPIIQSADPTAV